MRRLCFGIPLFIMACSGLYLNSCTAGSCFDETESRVKGTFYSMATGKTLSPDSVTLYGVNMDTLEIYDRTTMLKSAEFPLYAEEQGCKFVIRINGINDTLEFSYSSYPHLLSKECGYTFFFTLDTVIHSVNIIDSISIEKKTITTFNEENLRIFY
jgi:predicted nucleic-acid-binding Zn-ribbon protein